ncbi:hypothetical protein FQZ97_926600 [compost metagenome]
MAASPTGAWAGQAGKLAFWRGAANAWTFVTPKTGWRFEVLDEGAYYRYSGSAWVLQAPIASPVISETTTSRTLALSDAQSYIRTTNAGVVTITVPPQSSVAWLANTEVHFEQGGAGQITFAAGSGVTINRVGSTNAKTNGQYAVVSLKRVAADTWTLFGLLEATA